MIKDGALKNPTPEHIIGQHVFPDLEVGHVGMRSACTWLLLMNYI